MRAIMARYAATLAWSAVVGLGRPDHNKVVRAAYRAALRREPDESGLRLFVEQLRTGRLTAIGLLRMLVDSNEYRELHGLPPAYPRYLDALHHARRLLAEQHLPAAEVVVDLGGASSQNPEGALIELGYPFSPREIVIVDLPPDQRIGVGDPVRPPPTMRAARGTQIRYLYRPMTDLEPIEADSVDLVYSGESIEHITEEEADAVCRETFRVLREGGHFCLDTPNALLTRLQSPDELIHPEHKKEYTVTDLCAKLERHGFDVIETMAVCPMPESRRSGVFRAEEMIESSAVTPDAEDGYIFYVRAIKPPV